MPKTFNVIDVSNRVEDLQRYYEIYEQTDELEALSKAYKVVCDLRKIIGKEIGEIKNDN